MIKILEYTLDGLTEKFKTDYGKGTFHAKALFREIFKKGNISPLEADEFKKSSAFAAVLDKAIEISPGIIVKIQKEENLVKFVTRLNDGLIIESVIIPMTGYNTLCISSQAGCRMGCKFCETGKNGLKRNLTVEEITGQLYNARHTLGHDIRNVVFMGMGEPFDNFDNLIQAIKVINEQRGFDIALSHITISSSGLINGIEKLASYNFPGIRLAISINAPNNEIRSFLMPVNRRIPMERLKQSLEKYPLKKKGTFLFEYILIKGINDSDANAIELADFIKPLPVRLNLIPLNPVKNIDFLPPSDKDIHRFGNILSQNGIFVINRWTRGRSVTAGCGQLGGVLNVQGQALK